MSWTAWYAAQRVFNAMIYRPFFCFQAAFLLYSGFNLNQDKATATAVYTEYIRELATQYWFKLNSL
nr:hypothetical protein [Alysiella crassa]UOP06216.1 hypothetical protein LVJ80_10360 [Alysiella crassa]